MFGVVEVEGDHNLSVVRAITLIKELGGDRYLNIFA